MAIMKFNIKHSMQSRLIVIKPSFNHLYTYIVMFELKVMFLYVLQLYCKSSQESYMPKIFLL